MKEVVTESLAGERIDRALSTLTGRSRSDIALAISEGLVTVNGAVVSTRSYRLSAGDLVEADVSLEVPEERVDPDEAVRFAVVHEDEHVIVVDKPAGLVVHPGSGVTGGTLANGLLHRYPELVGVGAPDRPGIVHRLDAGTSGLLVVARTPFAYDALVDAMSAHRVGRTYIAVVVGNVGSEAGEIDAPIGRSERDRTKMAVALAGREALTRYRVTHRYEVPVVVTQLECTLETGRTHQIRVHLSAIGHPVAGDERYGGAVPEIQLDRPFLHASELTFGHPHSGERVTFDSPLPDDLSVVLQSLT